MGAIQAGNIEVAIEPQPAGSETVESGGFAASDQGDQDAPPLSLSTAEIQPETAANIEGQNLVTAVDPVIDAVEIGDSVASVDLQIAGPDTVEIGDSAASGVTAPVPSLTNNSTEQSAVQPIPRIPFPVFRDPFQYELEKLRRESEYTKKTYEETKSILNAELESKMAEIQAEYEREFEEVYAEYKTKANGIKASKDRIMLNKLRANAFLSKCTDKNTSSPSAPPRDSIRKLGMILRSLPSAPTSVLAPAPVPVPAPPPVPVQPAVALPSAPTLVLAPSPVLVQPAVALQPQAFAARHPPILYTYKRRKGNAV